MGDSTSGAHRDEQYPSEDDRDDRDAALTAAYRLMVETPEDLAAERAAGGRRPHGRP